MEKCPYCEFEIADAHGLAIHKGRIHPIEWEAEKQVEKDKRKFTCEYCDSLFLNPNAKRVHEVAKHWDALIADGIAKKIASEERSEKNADTVPSESEPPEDKTPEAQGTTSTEEDALPITAEPKEDDMAEVTTEEVRALLASQKENLTQAINMVKMELRGELKEVSQEARDGQKVTSGQEEKLSKAMEAATQFGAKVQAVEEKLTETNGKIPALEATVVDINGRVDQLPTEERIQELISGCLADPDSGACQVVAGMIDKASEHNGMVIHTEGGDRRIGHKLWDEVMSCVTCHDDICEVLPGHTDLLQKALSKVGEADKNKLQEMLGEIGFVRKPAKKKGIFA